MIQVTSQQTMQLIAAAVVGWLIVRAAAGTRLLFLRTPSRYDASLRDVLVYDAGVTLIVVDGRDILGPAAFVLETGGALGRRSGPRSRELRSREL
jgi:hypothetical protein